ncbi:lysozyme inhibitor LprI family protein [Devosia sp. YIM 151766]|uniref:lysozyme inhibitor LprI family protein n=1 Tax=Devosia sp. YIM 151766 TaxID=3017325 RepID=UPI00255CA321|nr:lysozyme inhibitor LprI family protein [Devosia sp. YIM 151766]WIY52421.1 lysozyme inhibitor LprI family protein [Devosia sp. YIM 151766]
MIDRSAVLDLDIETALARAAKNYCRAADRDAIAAAQSAWLDYRESYCTLIENSPGNTGAWINAGACRLDLTQKRLESLVFLTDHAYAWCRDLQLLRAASHFGDPTGLARSDEEAGIAWATRQDGDQRLLDISLADGQRETIDITSCSYCNGGADCDDGIFLFARENDEGDVSHAIANLCTVDGNGPRLEILGPVPAAPPARAVFSATNHIGWVIESGQLRITQDGEQGAVWPTDE